MEEQLAHRRSGSMRYSGWVWVWVGMDMDMSAYVICRVAAANVEVDSADPFH